MKQMCYDLEGNLRDYDELLKASGQYATEEEDVKFFNTLKSLNIDSSYFDGMLYGVFKSNKDDYSKKEKLQYISILYVACISQLMSIDKNFIQTFNELFSHKMSEYITNSNNLTIELWDYLDGHSTDTFTQKEVHECNCPNCNEAYDTTRILFTDIQDLFNKVWVLRRYDDLFFVLDEYDSFLDETENLRSYYDFNFDNEVIFLFEEIFDNVKVNYIEGVEIIEK